MADLTMVLLGKTGGGKSSSGNTILGDNSKFLVKCSPKSETSSCEVQTGTRLETEIQIIDTPGFFDSRKPDEELKPELVKCITLSAPGPHAFIIVLKVERFTRHETETLTHITESIGEGAFKYSAVLFTHGDDLEEDQTIEQFVEQSTVLKELVEKCGGGCHVIDNKYWNQEHEYRSNRVQVEKLLNTIKEMARQNEGDCYTNKMLKLVGAEVSKEVEKVKKDNPNECESFKEACCRFIKKLLVKWANLTAELILGALLGIEKDVLECIALYFARAAAAQLA